MSWRPLYQAVEYGEVNELNCGWRFGMPSHGNEEYGGVVVADDGIAYTITTNPIDQLVCSVAREEFGEQE